MPEPPEPELPWGDRVRLVREPIHSALRPLDVLRLLRGEELPFALVGAWAGGGALLGSEPLAVAGAGEHPFALLEHQPEVDGGIAGAVGGGWVGYLGYQLGARLERLPPPPPRRARLPAFSLAFYDHLLRLDAGGQWWFEALWSPARERRLSERLDRLRTALGGAAPPPRPFALGPFSAQPGRAGHTEAVRWCRRYIAAGDLYQANLCLRLEASFEGDALDLFGQAAEALAPDRAAYLAGPWGAIASLSPELFLRRTGRSVLSAPIKGTHVDRSALLASAKDRAENVMIVDLVRNDLGRSCDYGSVGVPALARADAGPGVWHLVSEVAGELAPGVGDGDLVRGCFPPGSVTGAPKIKAMQVIAELESTGREAYTGAIGYASPLAGLELNVAIRTFELADGRAWLGAGGGITWGSDPDAEYSECLTKARPLLVSAGATLVEDERAGRAPRAPSRRPRPDPARGVFETVLVLGGEPVALGAHLRRLGVSVAELYGQALESDLAARVLAAAAAGPGPARLRVVAAPGSESVIERVETVRHALFPADALDLRALVLPGGLGAHKWVDRQLVGETPEPLVIDLDGELLESGSGNLFIVEGGALVTPPLDGRILPGVTRELVIGLGFGVAEEPLDAERAREADELFVTSAIRGVQSIARCDGVGEWSARTTARSVAAALR